MKWELSAAGRPTFISFSKWHRAEWFIGCIYSCFVLFNWWRKKWNKYESLLFSSLSSYHPLNGWEAFQSECFLCWKCSEQDSHCCLFGRVLYGPDRWHVSIQTGAIRTSSQFRSERPRRFLSALHLLWKATFLSESFQRELTSFTHLHKHHRRKQEMKYWTHSSDLRLIIR